MAERRLLEVEYGPEEEEIVVRLRSPLARLLPPEVRSHMLAARREMLLALRSLVDAAIEGLEERERRAGSRRRTEIKVE